MRHVGPRRRKGREVPPLVLGTALWGVTYGLRYPGLVYWAAGCGGRAGRGGPGRGA